MSVKYGKIELPERISSDKEHATSTYGRFVAEPFERGAGHTIGNSLRRFLLTSLEAPAIVSVRIEGVLHEYEAIPGIVEDMVNIVLNLKGALLRKLATDEVKFARELRYLSKVIEVTREMLDEKQGSYSVKLGELIDEGVFEVVNPELHLFTITKPMKRQIDLRVAMGRGYVPVERQLVRNKTADEILIDALFSPVRLVNYFVENTRVGQDTDYDRLILEVITDGRVTPTEALSFSAQIAQKHFDVFTRVQEQELTFDETEGESESDIDEMMEKLCLRVDEMVELSVRSVNCLKGANIETIGELVVIPERKMLEFKNFGKKSLSEIKAKLEEMLLHLGMDLGRYGITQENVRAKLKEYSEERKRKLQEEAEEESEE